MSKKFDSFPAFLFLVVLGTIGFMASPAMAVKEFRDAFKAKYIHPGSTAANDVALAEAFEQANCAVCHVGESKKLRNDYGKQIGKLASKRDKKNAAKIQAALEAVGKLKSNPADPASPTFGEIISSGKLPASN